MSLEENKAVIRRLIEAFNKHNVALLDNFMAHNFVDHNLQVRELESYKQFETKFIKGFPDYHETIEDILAEGAKVWHRLKVTGTHTGEWRGLAPTGKKVTLTGVNFWRIVDGKIVEREGVYDLLAFLKQLGVIDAEKAKKLLPELVS